MERLASYELTEEDKKAIDRGLEAVREGDIATDEDVEALFAKYRQPPPGKV